MNALKTRKTHRDDRGSYIYQFVDGTKHKFVPGKDGITVDIVKKLHSLDDSEVYFNSKKQAAGEWEVSLDETMSTSGAENKYDRLVVMEDDEAAERKERLYEVMDKHLTQRQRIIVRLVGIEGYSEKEVAQIMGLSVSTVSKHYLAGRKNIKKYF